MNTQMCYSLCKLSCANHDEPPTISQKYITANSNSAKLETVTPEYCERPVTNMGIFINGLLTVYITYALQ